MGQIKNIKLHIVTDIKESVIDLVVSQQNKMTNTVEKSVVEPVEEKKVEKESTTEPETTTTEDKPVEKDSKNVDKEEENGNGHAEEADGEEATLKRKDAPTEIEEDSPKKKKLLDADEKEAEPPAVEA